MSSEQLDAIDQWILCPEASRWLDEVSASTLPVHQLATRLRRDLSAEQSRAVLELAELRRRGKRKFTRADDMFFTRLGLEQATDEWIARYKANRFANRPLADLCSGIGGDAIGLAGVADELTLVDRSTVAIRFAERNVRAYARDRFPLTAHVGDVESFAIAETGAWHIDPDRRPGLNRTTKTELHEPSDSVVDNLLAQNPNAAIKLAPGCEPPARWSDRGELEWISRDGECKQLVVWHGELATAVGERRATMIESIDESYAVARTLVGSEVAAPHNDAIDRYVFEPDAAVLASGLVGTLAAEHDWWTFASTGGYLTGPEGSDEPACAAFEVQDVLPLNVKKLSRYLRERNIGHVEIKHRAIDHSPEKMQRDLKLKGDNLATLLLTRVGEKRIAIIVIRL